MTLMAGVLGSYLTVRPNFSGGILAKFFFKAQDVPSAGASGALFGLVGVLFVFGIKFRRELPEGFKRAFGTGMLPIILINLFIGYVGRGLIDNAAHVGGLVAGAALAVAVQYRRPGERKGVAATWRVLQGAALGLCAACFVNVARHINLPPLNQTPQVHAPIDPAFIGYANAMNKSQEAFAQALHENDAANIEESIRTLDSVPPVDPTADDLKRRLKELLARAKEVTNNPGDATAQKNRSALIQDFTHWSREYGQWLRQRVGDSSTNDNSH